MQMSGSLTPPTSFLLISHYSFSSNSWPKALKFEDHAFFPEILKQMMCTTNQENSLLGFIIYNSRFAAIAEDIFFFFLNNLISSQFQK